MAGTSDMFVTAIKTKAEEKILHACVFVLGFKKELPG
jgi:hypothetical protein